MEAIWVLAGVAAGIGLILALRGKGGGGEVADLKREMQTLNQRIAADTGLLVQRLEGLDTRMTQTQLAGQDLAVDIFSTLGDLRSATTAVAEQAKEFTALQDLLRAPKARGGLGEAMLEELLGQVLPPSAYEMQYRFAGGAIVDAAVRAGGRIVCIDSKFPLANYRRIYEAGDEIGRAEAERAFAADVVKHIHDISSKYILPDEQTLDFAVMYVPAEGVYGEVLRLSSKKRSVFELAIAERVVPMSPLTLYGYLQTILYGLKCLRIEEHAQEILGFCGQLQQDMARFAEDFEVMGRHIGNARSKYDESVRKLDRLRYRLDRVANLTEGDPAGDQTEGLEGPEAANRREPFEVIRGS